MDTGTSGVDIGTLRGTPRGETTPRVPNAVLLELRKSQGWGRPRLARELHKFCLAKKWSSPGEVNIAKQIYRLETGRVKLPDDFYARLYCQFYQKSSDELFGCMRQIASAVPPTYELRSHKFIPLYVGAEAVETLKAVCNMTAAPGQWFECFSVPVPTNGDSCHLYVWPFGVAMYHLVEDLTSGSIAEVAVWRHVSYIDNMAWAEEQINRLAGCGARNEIYVLGAYWVNSVAREGVRTDTAIRILCIPEVLIERTDDRHTPSKARAELVEQALLRDGFDHTDIEDFGIQGISTALASWSGVVYRPLAPYRALTEQDLVRCELAVQSAWSYCSYIRSEVEQGRDPVVPAAYGWRFMRGLRSRLTTERPQETPQQRSMREAIVKTSGLAGHLTQALEVLRE
jgi:hypothetical protein